MAQWWLLVTAVILSLVFLSPPWTVHALDITEDNIQVLTFVSACPDRHFTCPNPVEIAAPGRLGECVPYDPNTADVRGSFTITWSDSPSLPSGTTVAVCTTVHLWTLSQCRGDRFTVEMPNLAQVLLQVKSEIAEGGDLLRLGYSGPWENQASFEAISCGNITTWHTKGEPSQFTGLEEIDAPLIKEQLAYHRITFPHYLLLVVGLSMVVFALVGMAVACAFSDTLAKLALIEDMEQSSIGSSTASSWLFPSAVTWGSGTGATVCVDPDKVTMVDALRMAVLDLVCSRWSLLVLRTTEPFAAGRPGSRTPADVEVPLNPIGEV